ncbi:MAG: 8-oxo-dGTP diphosphatase [Candidatus Micrarchaeia archaeon]
MNVVEYRNKTKINKEYCLGFLVKEDNVLLAIKKRGYGVGKLNGIGGKLEPSERSEDAMIRETFEEISVKVTELENKGNIVFYNPNDAKSAGSVDLFLIHRWEGTPKESEEMKPKWFHRNAIPFHEMWSDDKYWLKRVLSGESIKAEFLLDDRKNEVIDYIIRTKRDI